MAKEFYAQKYSDQVLQCVKASNLHYAVQETPFSVYITLRKKLTSHPGQNIPQPAQSNKHCDLALENELMKATLKQTQVEKEALEIDNEGLRAELTAIELARNCDEDTIGELDDKLSKAKHELGEAMQKINSLEKASKDKVEEVKTFKDTLKGFKEEVNLKNEDLKVMKKNLKQKDKEIYNLKIKADNLEDTIKTAKEDITRKNRDLTELKKEIRKSEKNSKKLSKSKSMIPPATKSNLLVTTSITTRPRVYF